MGRVTVEKRMMEVCRLIKWEETKRRGKLCHHYVQNCLNPLPSLADAGPRKLGGNRESQRFNDSRR